MKELSFREIKEATQGQVASKRQPGSISDTISHGQFSIPRHVLNLKIMSNAYRNCLSLCGVYCLTILQVGDAQMLLPLIKLTLDGRRINCAQTGPGEGA